MYRYFNFYSCANALDYKKVVKFIDSKLLILTVHRILSSLKHIGKNSSFINHVRSKKNYQKLLIPTSYSKLK